MVVCSVGQTVARWVEKSDVLKAVVTVAPMDD